MKPRQVKPPRGGYGTYGRPQAARPSSRRRSNGLGARLARIPRRYVIAVVVVGLVAFGLSQAFAIKRVTVNAPERRDVILQSAREIVAGGGRQANILTLDSSSFVQALMQRQPAIKTAEVQRNWPGGITVNATLKQPSLGWVSGNQRYLVDRDGTVIGLLEQNTPVPVVADQKNLPVSVGQRVTTARFIEFVTASTKGLAALGLAPTKLEVKDTTLDLYVTTSKGYYVLLDTSRPAADELADLAVIKRTLDAQKRTPAEYIDLRIEGKAYYK